MFTLRQVIGVLLSPLSLALLAVLVALLLKWRGHHRPARVALVSAAVLAWLVSTPLVGRMLLAPLESAHPPLNTVSDDVRFIVVLGSGYTPRPDIPLSATLDEAGLYRLVEGLRLQRQAPAATLVFSGSGPPGVSPPALGGKALAEALGEPGAKAVALQGPRNTREEAVAVCRLVGRQRFVVVTSASHMPRALEWMRLAGCRGDAAPTGQKGVLWGGLPGLLPDSAGLEMSEDAVHEYLGWFALLSGIG